MKNYLNADSCTKRKTAREAATLLYFGAEKEYRQAKLKAAKTLGTHFLPTNLEVAIEMDKIAEENEGSARKERLIQMRQEALKIMRILRAHCPLLIGSVWRGTIRHGSDIDIAVFSDMPDEILGLLEKAGFRISKTEWINVTKKGTQKASLHVYMATPGKKLAELVVRSTEQAGHRRKCEIFGDQIKGLNIQELERVLEESPTQKFIPA